MLPDHKGVAVEGFDIPLQELSLVFFAEHFRGLGMLPGNGICPEFSIDQRLRKALVQLFDFGSQLSALLLYLRAASTSRNSGSCTPHPETQTTLLPRHSRKPPSPGELDPAIWLHRTAA
jgi:hypothetical protein